MAFTRRSLTHGAAGLFVTALSGRALAQSKCSFNPIEPAVRLLKGGRNVRLLEQYIFIDAVGRSWPVPSETEVDGASIPQIFWSVIGGPFEGQYRGPSIVHDFYCDKRSRKFADVHQMFREAMLCAGVDTRKAFVMYEAVRRFGPRWADPRPHPPQCDVPSADYDFDLCTVNATIPEKTEPTLGRNELEQFINDVKSGADAQDIAVLRRELQKL